MQAATLLVFVSAICTAPEPAKSADKDMLSLQGEWIASRVEALREEVKDSKKIQLLIEGDKLLMSGTKEKESYTFKIDSSKTPKTIDLYQGDKLVSRSIYAQDKDELRLCLGLAHWRVSLDGKKRELHEAGDRPTEFDSRQGVLFVLRRAKAK